MYGVTDVNSKVNSAFTPESYKDFLEQHIVDWSYFKVRDGGDGAVLRYIQ